MQGILGIAARIEYLHKSIAQIKDPRKPRPNKTYTIRDFEPLKTPNSS